jgi:hypothetical protein
MIAADGHNMKAPLRSDIPHEPREELEAVKAFLEENGYWAIPLTRVRASGWHSGVMYYQALNIFCALPNKPDMQSMEICVIEDAMLELSPGDVLANPWPRFRVDLHDPNSFQDILKNLEGFFRWERTISP